MGVDVRITLPGFATVRHVADVIGILSGNKVSITRSHGYEFVRVEGVEVQSIPNLPEGANITILDGDGNLAHRVMYHFEWQSDGTRGLLPRSTPFWLAVGKALVDFYGGKLDYNDSDSTDVDYEVEPRTELAGLDDDETFERLQQRLRELQPLTRGDIDAMTERAAYTLAGDWR